MGGPLDDPAFTSGGWAQLFWSRGVLAEMARMVTHTSAKLPATSTAEAV